MKKFLYISILAILVLFSCSKEQPLSPNAASDITESSMKKDPVIICASGDGDIIKNDDNDDSITDPEKGDKDKSNKKAKN